MKFALIFITFLVAHYFIGAAVVLDWAWWVNITTEQRSTNVALGIYIALVGAIAVSGLIFLGKDN